MPTHGSLTKAGKVRNQTPKIGVTKKKKLGPRRHNIRNFQRLLAGERLSSRERRRRRRR